MLCAFEGWNDAGSSATEALTYLERVFSAQPLSASLGDDFFDLSTSRPLLISQDDGTGEITWPEVTMQQWENPEKTLRVISVTGPEPQLKWKQFTQELLDIAQQQEVDAVILCGGLLAEVPHTRPFPISITSYSPSLREQEAIEKQNYTGPTGIVGVLALSAAAKNLKDLSLWVSIPHYAGHPPHPKATYLLLQALESILGISIPLHTIEEETLAWERGAAELMDEEPELARYVEQLENEQESTKLEEVSGEDIAAEFEQFLKRRDS